MGKHAGTAELTTTTHADVDADIDKAEDAALSTISDAGDDQLADGARGDAVEATDSSSSCDDAARPRAGRRLRRPSAAIAVGAAVVVTLGALGGWLGYRVYENHQLSAERAMFLQAARQGVINLTTIDHATVDADIARILDSSTGAFHDDFQKRAQPFAQVVRQVQSKSQGTVTTAAIETENGNQAQVLVNVSMTMSDASVPEQQPRSWRMRINVQKTGDTAKISDVQFVP